MQYDLNRLSRPVEIVPYQERWAEEFERAASDLRRVVGDLAERIDHIGSTSVPGLGAKDIVDIQMSVSDLDDIEDFCRAMVEMGGYQRRGMFHRDHIPVGTDDESPAQWLRAYFREPEGTRRTHIHVRETGRSNQVYALLFRDYLRAHPEAAVLYEQTKRRLAELFPNRIDAYLYVKDPVCDILMRGAAEWQKRTEWVAGPSDA